MNKALVLSLCISLLMACSAFGAEGDQQKVVVVPLRSSAPAGALPLAWGNITSFGSILSSYNVASVSRLSLGNLEIILEKGWSGYPAVIATPYSGIPLDEIATWSYVNPNKVLIHVTDGTGAATDSDVGFVIFGMPE